MAGQQGSRPDTAGRGACHVLVGETGAGKTDVAQLIAEELGWTVCSADSMQVYRGMDVGTAKPTAEQQARQNNYRIASKRREDPLFRNLVEQDHGNGDGKNSHPDTMSDGPRSPRPRRKMAPDRLRTGPSPCADAPRTVPSRTDT